MFGWGAKRRQQNYRQRLIEMSTTWQMGFFVRFEEGFAGTHGAEKAAKMAGGLCNFLFLFGDLGPKIATDPEARALVSEALADAYLYVQEGDVRAEMAVALIVAAAAQRVPLDAFSRHIKLLLDEAVIDAGPMTPDQVLSILEPADHIYFEACRSVPFRHATPPSASLSNRRERHIPQHDAETASHAQPVTRELQGKSKQNRWPHGPRNWKLPPLPATLAGRSGCMLQDAIFDEAIGSEVYLAILDDPTQCFVLAGIRPFKLACKNGIAQTDSGSVVFLLWRAAWQSKSEIIYEQYLNPNNATALRLMSALAQQSHLKVLLVNSITSEMVGEFEFENIFGFDRLAAAALQSIGSDTEIDFDRAIQEFTRQYSIEELLGGE